jgi:hypothetical protein
VDIVQCVLCSLIRFQYQDSSEECCLNEVGAGMTRQKPFFNDAEPWFSSLGSQLVQILSWQWVKHRERGKSER